MNSKIKVGIIGFDHWYWAFGLMYSFCLRDDVEVVGIWDRIPEKAQKIAEAYHIPKTYAKIDLLLADKEIDAVVITTPTSEQPGIVVKAAAAKKQLLLGKPLARTLKEADEVIDTVRNTGVKAMALASGELDAAPIKELINQANIGRICTAHFSTYAIPPMSEPGNIEPGWFVDPQKAAGGGFLDHAIYGAGILRYLFDDEVESIYAQIDKYCLKDLDVEDYGAAMIRFKQGAIAFLESTFTAPVESHDRILIIGDEGELEIRGDEVIVWNKNEAKSPRRIRMLPENPNFSRFCIEKSIPTPPGGEGYRGAAEAFINLLNSTDDGIKSLLDAKKALEICLAAYVSADTGVPVKLPITGETDVPQILKDNLEKR